MEKINEERISGGRADETGISVIGMNIQEIYYDTKIAKLNWQFVKVSRDDDDDYYGAMLQNITRGQVEDLAFFTMQELIELKRIINSMELAIMINLNEEIKSIKKCKGEEQ